MFGKLQYFLLVILGFLAYLNLSSEVYGQYYSQNGLSPRIIVDKKLRPISDKYFYDNISSDQKTFSENDEVEFKIVVENTGDIVLKKLYLVDYLPNYLSLLYYPGIYNKSNSTITTEIDNIEPGQIREYFVRARIVDLPVSFSGNTKKQIINKVTVTSDKISDSDEVKYFVSAKNVPVTGNSGILLESVILIGIIGSSIFLRKYARGY